MSWRSTAVLSAAIVLAIGLPIVFSQRAQENTAVATTVDAKDFDQLWLDLQFLQDEAPELDAAEYKRRVVRKTARYLELDSDQELRFAEVVDLELGDLRDARARMEKINLQTTHSSENPLAVIALRNAWRRWQHEQKMASDRLLDALQSTPPALGREAPPLASAPGLQHAAGGPRSIVTALVTTHRVHSGCRTR